MIMVVAWSAILLSMSIVVGQTVLTQVGQSDVNEQSYRALAAAEAGLDDFMARVSGNSNYYAVSAGTKAANPAVSDWASIQGGDGSTSYRYDWATPSAATAGDVVVTSTGRYFDGDRTVYRTIEARMSKRTSFDYAFFSSLNTQLPTWPGAYKDTSGNSLVELAKTLCSRYWWSKGQRVDNSTTNPWHRNSLFCTFPEITSRNRYFGALHTNDLWYISGLSNTSPDQPLNRNPLDDNMPGQVFNGPVTSSCNAATGDFATGQPGCPVAMSWIDASAISSTSDPGASKNKYEIDEFTWQATGLVNPALLKSRLWNPGYAPPIEFARSFNDAKVNVDVKAQASSAGCVFTGPTRIRFLADGRIAVTSPDTKDAGATCGGTSLLEDWWQRTSVSDPTQTNDQVNTAPPTTTTDRLHPTQVITLPSTFNGVIYVQNVPTSSSDPNWWPVTPNVKADVSVDTTATTNASQNAERSRAPSCRLKSTAGSFYPFVIPSDEQADARFGSGSLNKGWPLEKATGGDIWTEGLKCRQGTVYVEGDFNGRFTLAAEGDIVFTGNLKDPLAKSTFTAPPRPATLPTGYPLIRGDDLTYGRPPAASQSIMGLIPQKMLYFFNPTSTEASGYVRNENWIINAATISLSECVAVQNYESAGRLGDLTLVGSLGQNYSCNLTGPGGSTRSGGFETMTVAYDQRYVSLVPPPLFEDIFFAEWEIETIREIAPPL